MHYIPGCDNYLADFLSRSIEPDTKIAEVNAIEFQSSIDWNKEQAKDPAQCPMVPDGYMKSVSFSYPTKS